MIRLPSIPQISGTPVNMPGVSAAAVGAPAAALTGLGRQLAEVSDQFFGTAIQMQKLKNARTVSEKRMNLQSEWSALELELEKDPDPENMIRRTQEFFEARKGTIDDPELPPAVRDEMGEFYQQFAHRGTIQMSERAASKEIKRTSLALENEIDGAVRLNDIDGAAGAIDRMVTGGVILPEQAESMKQKVGERIALNGHQAAILQDANGWMEQHPRDTVPDGMDPDTFRQLYGQAESEMRRQTSDDIEGALDVIHSDKPVTEEELQKSIAHLKPSVRARIMNSWWEKQGADYKAMTNTPAYQAEIVGQVSMMLADYNPDGEGFDEKYVQMDAAVRTLPEGNPVRAELMRQIGAARDGGLQEVKDTRSLAMKALDDAAKAGRFGTLDDAAPAIQKTEKAINDGFLRDSKKLAALGFSPAQIEEIFAPVPKGNDETREPRDTERRARFEMLWEFREGEDKAESSVRNTALAIVNQETDIKDMTPEAVGRRSAAVQNTQRALGEAKIKLQEWIHANPKATPREIEDKVMDIGGSAARSTIRTGMLPARPTRAAIPAETSMNLPAPLQPLMPSFRKAGAQYGIDPRVLAAIAMHETAAGTSRAFREKKNAMGVSNAKGPIAFGDASESIERMARLLGSSTKGPYKNARTLQEIASIYAPIGAGNDPGNLNRHWVAGVSKYLRQLGGDPSALIKA